MADTFTAERWTWHRGQWKSKVLAAGVSREKADALVAAAVKSCTVEHPCVYPFKTCNGGYTISVERD